MDHVFSTPSYYPFVFWVRYILFHNPTDTNWTSILIHEWKLKIRPTLANGYEELGFIPN